MIRANCPMHLVPLLFLAVFSISAQDTLPVQTRLRVWATEPAIAGRVVLLLGADSQRVRLGDVVSRSEWLVPRTSLTRVDTAAPPLRTAAATTTGALLGGAAGLALDYFVAPGSCIDECRTLPLGLLAGAVIGGVIGHHIASSRWLRLAQPAQLQVRR
jgi:hypothetical protein